MFPDDKIIEIFSMCDDFSKNLDDIIQKNSIDARESTKKRKYHRDGTSHQRDGSFDDKNM